jgi:hypothetical protein
MEDKIYKIAELDVGQIVDAPDGYYRVKKCPHGFKYYEYLGVTPWKAGIDENTDVRIVADIDEHRTLNSCDDHVNRKYNKKEKT